MQKRIKQDKEAVAALRKDEEKTFAFLFRQYYTALCFFANNILHNEEEAKDIVQNSFIKLWHSQTSMARPDTIKSFLYTIVRNQCLNVLKRRKVQMKAQHELQNLTEAEPFDEITHAEIMRQVFGHIDVLPVQMQTVFKQYYIEGKNYKEIAHTLNTSPETVRKQRNTALKIIRQKLLLLLFVIC